jgi:hypothetical protein
VRVAALEKGVRLMYPQYSEKKKGWPKRKSEAAEHPRMVAGNVGLDEVQKGGEGQDERNEGKVLAALEEESDAEGSNHQANQEAIGPQTLAQEKERGKGVCQKRCRSFSSRLPGLEEGFADGFVERKIENEDSGSDYAKKECGNEDRSFEAGLPELLGGGRKCKKNEGDNKEQPPFDAGESEKPSCDQGGNIIERAAFSEE